MAAVILVIATGNDIVPMATPSFGLAQVLTVLKNVKKSQTYRFILSIVVLFLFAIVF